MAVIKPFRLFPGDRVGIVSPSSSFEKRGLMRGLEKIRWWGFEPVFRKKIFKPAPRPKRYEYKANEIIEMFQDPTINAIFCAEGGYGSIALIPYLDEVDLSPFPKVFVGYSDITILLIYFFQRYGWVTFHGPTVAQEIYKGMPPRMEQSLLAALTESKRLEDVAGHALEVIRPGHAVGRLVGGNLVRLVRTLGTPFEIQTRNRILFLEEVDEGYMEIDGSLNHLKLAGKFDGIRGIVFSEMTGCLHNSRKNVRSYLRRYFRDVPFPVFLGFPSGHGIENVTIPLGIRVSINSKQKRLIFEEAGVR